MLMLQVGRHCSKMLGHAEMHRNVFADLYSILFLGVGSLTFSSLTFILWEMGIAVPALQMERFAAAAKSLHSCPTLCDPIDGNHQAPPSLGFSRQEHWSGLPFPSPMHESAK